MGGSIALLTALQSQVTIEHCVMDGGITPYRLPWIITRLIALKDYLMMMFGRIGGVGLLEKAFSTDEYSKEDLEYVSEVLRHCNRKNFLLHKTLRAEVGSAKLNYSQNAGFLNSFLILATRRVDWPQRHGFYL